MCIIAIKYTYIERVRYTFKKIVTNIVIIRVALWPFFSFFLSYFLAFESQISNISITCESRDFFSQNFSLNMNFIWE